MVGWGRSSTNKFDKGSIFDTGAATSILQQLKVPIVPFDECKSKLPSTGISDENHICAGAEIGMLFSCFTFQQIFKSSYLTAQIFMKEFDIGTTICLDSYLISYNI